MSLRLRKTPAEVMHQVTYVDFLRYQAIFEKELNEPDKRDWYAAQIAYEVCCVPFRVWGKQPPATLTLKSFLMKFGAPDPEARKVIDDAHAADIDENYVNMQMLYWGIGLGLGMPGQEADASPVQTKMPPGMQPPPPAAREGVLPGVETTPHPVPATERPPPGVTFTPSGPRRRRRN